MPEILVIDIGNTRIACGLFARGKILSQTHLPKLTLKGVADLARGRDLGGCVFASVVPAETAKLEKIWAKAGKGPICRLNWEVVGAALRNKIKVLKMTPGDDRAANAYLLSKRGLFPAVSVDAGTALTAEVLDSGGVFLGGLIAPGEALQRESLQGRTAQLKDLGKSGLRKLVGNTSEAAITAGVEGLAVLGLLGWLAETEKEVLRKKFRAVVFTGGGAELYYKAAKKRFPSASLEPNFTLKALGYSFYDEKMRKLFAKLQNVRF